MLMGLLGFLISKRKLRYCGYGTTSPIFYFKRLGW